MILVLKSSLFHAYDLAPLSLPSPIPNSAPIFTPPRSIWLRHLGQKRSRVCVPGSFVKNDSTSFQKAVSSQDVLSLKLKADEVTGKQASHTPQLSNTVVVDIERNAVKTQITSDLHLSPRCRLIEMIVHPKQVSRKQVPTCLKQGLGIFTDALLYEHYPAVDLYDTNLVEVQFFDILVCCVGALNRHCTRCRSISTRPR